MQTNLAFKQTRDHKYLFLDARAFMYSRLILPWQTDPCFFYGYWCNYFVGIVDCNGIRWFFNAIVYLPLVGCSWEYG